MRREEAPGDFRYAAIWATVSHGKKEWVRDDDDDGVREVHITTIEGLWQTLRNFLRPFRGVHKRNLKFCVAMCKHRINRKRISLTFISQLVEAH